MNATTVKDPVVSVHPLLPWAAAAGGGVLAFLGYVGFDQVYLEWICLVPVLWALKGQPPRRAFLIGWVAGIVGHAGGFYWIAITLREFANASWPLAVLGVLGLAAANGLVFAWWAWGTRLITANLGWNVIWVSPVLWTAIEKFWPQLFPNYLGASQYRLTLVTQIADITGILGVTFLLLFVNSVLFESLERVRNKQPRPWLPAVILAGVLAAVLAYGAVRMDAVQKSMKTAATMKVGVVQTNRGAGDKYVDAARFLREHQELSKALIRASSPDIIVWPEGILGMNLSSREGTLPASVIDDLRTPLLLGAIIQTREGGEARVYNSAVLADREGRIAGTYDKTVLVPFGEYIPFGDIFPQFYAWSPYSGRMWQGQNAEPLRLEGRTLSVNICYEDIFPVHIRRLMQGGKDHRIPEALFNMTNDSWYGNTTQPLEHLVLASFRSIEHRRALVRSTNTGISAYVDPLGRIAARTGQWTRGTLATTIPLMEGRTVYGVLGDWVGWTCAAIALYGIGRVWVLRRTASAPDAAGPRKRIRKKE